MSDDLNYESSRARRKRHKPTRSGTSPKLGTTSFDVPVDLIDRWLPVLGLQCCGILLILLRHSSSAGAAQLSQDEIGRIAGGLSRRQVGRWLKIAIQHGLVEAEKSQRENVYWISVTFLSSVAGDRHNG